MVCTKRTGNDKLESDENTFFEHKIMCGHIMGCQLSLYPLCMHVCLTVFFVFLSFVIMYKNTNNSWTVIVHLRIVCGYF